MTTNKIIPQLVRAGDKVARDSATRSEGKVYLGDGAIVFAPQPVRAGDKVARDSATTSEGKVYLGDAAPVFQK
jgi:hypothetical protein